MSKKYFHFTLGPVQSFVGQARRTRDFWAGSFLLSWLAGVAMQAVMAQAGKIVFPQADQDFLNAINGKGGNKPVQGSIPNRFKAEVNSDFDAHKVVAAVNTAWQQLAATIYDKELKANANDNTLAIWKRQLDNFWDMTWVLVAAAEDSSALDRRKNWRSHFYAREAGVKCTLMGDWQELSGIEGVGGQYRKLREEFWSKIAKNNNCELDFGAKEHLCAMAYIKRRFIKYFADFKIDLDGFAVHGWQLPQAVPSVAYIAAAPWYAKVLQQAEDSPEFADFFNAAKGLDLSEYASKINCIENASNNNKHKGLDGSAFHIADLENINKTSNQQAAKATKHALEKLIKQFGAISPFYAVLMMDGDSLGAQMSDINKQAAITQGLAEFTKKVPAIVYRHNGFLIYAGGDDVLALVTLEDALSCALELRSCYEQCFAVGKQEVDIKTSISAALIYEHIHSPLKNILHEAHVLLDAVAKEQAGRDAIAVRVYKGSGLALEWARKWDAAVEGDKFIIDDLQQKWRRQAEQTPQFSNKFFYKIRQRFDLLYGKDGQQQNPLSAKQAVELMAMEYMRSVDNKTCTIETATAIVAPLMQQSSNAAKRMRISADAALLIRFLAQKGIERGRN